MNKSIPELLDQDGNTHTDMIEIMEMQHSFYADLFTSKPTIPDSRYDTLTATIPTITEQQIDFLDKNIEELELAIKKSKLNKAPGPDRFSNKCFKTFCPELINWIFRAYNDAIKTNSLSATTRKGTITLIFKQGKDRNILKNWRPLTMLNCTYKFYSTILGDRLKVTLQSVVS